MDAARLHLGQSARSPDQSTENLWAPNADDGEPRWSLGSAVLATPELQQVEPWHSRIENIDLTSTYPVRIGPSLTAAEEQLLGLINLDTLDDEMRTYLLAQFSRQCRIPIAPYERKAYMIQMRRELEAACEQNTAAVAKILRKWRLVAHVPAPVPEDLTIAVDVAANHGQIEILRYLLSQGAEVDHTALILAAKHPQWAPMLLTMLLDELGTRRGFNIDSYTTQPLLHLVLHDMMATEWCLLQRANPNLVSFDGKTALDAAVCYANPALMAVLVTRGANLHASNVLHHATVDIPRDEDFVSMVDLLLNWHVNINALAFIHHEQFVNIKDNHVWKEGGTPWDSNLQPREAIIKQLNKTGTALHWAVKRFEENPRRHQTMIFRIKVLLNKGLDPNQVDARDCKALAYAYNEPLVQLLRFSRAGPIARLPYQGIPGGTILDGQNGARLGTLRLSESHPETQAIMSRVCGNSPSFNAPLIVHTSDNSEQSMLALQATRPPALAAVVPMTAALPKATTYPRSRIGPLGSVLQVNEGWPTWVSIKRQPNSDTLSFAQGLEKEEPIVNVQEITGNDSDSEGGPEAGEIRTDPVLSGQTRSSKFIQRDRLPSSNEATPHRSTAIWQGSVWNIGGRSSSSDPDEAEHDLNPACPPTDAEAPGRKQVSWANVLSRAKTPTPPPPPQPKLIMQPKSKAPQNAPKAPRAMTPTAGDTAHLRMSSYGSDQSFHGRRDPERRTVSSPHPASHRRTSFQDSGFSSKG